MQIRLLFIIIFINCLYVKPNNIITKEFKKKESSKKFSFNFLNESFAVTDIPRETLVTDFRPIRRNLNIEFKNTLLKNSNSSIKYFHNSEKIHIEISEQLLVEDDEPQTMTLFYLKLLTFTIIPIDIKEKFAFRFEVYKDKKLVNTFTIINSKVNYLSFIPFYIPFNLMNLTVNYEKELYQPIVFELLDILEKEKSL